MSADKDPSYLSNSKPLKNIGGFNSTYNFHEDFKEEPLNASESFKKENRFRKFCSWLQDKCRLLCIRGLTSMSEN